MARDRQSLSPALAGSAALHALLAAMLLIHWPWTKELRIGTAVPVKIVTNAPTTDLRPAIQAPEEQAAATEAPEPDAPVQAPAPPTPEPLPAPTPAPAAPKTPPPKPAPPAPAPKPTPTPKPAEKTPTAKPQPRQEVDLDKLLASVTKGGRPSGATRSSAARGPNRAETAVEARPAAGSGLSANAMAGMAEELQRRWNPNCDVEGGRDVKLKVIFNLGRGGMVVGEVTASGQERSADPVVKAAAERAIRAVYAASPFRGVPPSFNGDRISVNFNAREACS